MNRDRLRRRARPTTSCTAVQKSTSSSTAGGSGIASSSVTVGDHSIHRSLSLPAVVSLPTHVLASSTVVRWLTHESDK